MLFGNPQLQIGNRARFCRNSQSLGGHWSDWSKILDLVLWVPKQHVYQVSLKSETVGFNTLGDLTQNDPDMKYIAHDSKNQNDTKNQKIFGAKFLKGMCSKF